MEPELSERVLSSSTKALAGCPNAGGVQILTKAPLKARPEVSVRRAMRVGLPPSTGDEVWMLPPQLASNAVSSQSHADFMIGLPSCG